MRIYVILFCFTIGSFACSPSIQKAQRFHKAGQLQEALDAYLSVAEKGGTWEAFLAQRSVVHLVTDLEKWKQLPSEATKLVSYLDREDPFAKHYRNQPTMWAKSNRSIAQTLLSCGRKSIKRAKRLGDPVAYVAAGRLFGLYIERFPQKQGRVEAAAGRGVALAIRGDCKSAMRLFNQASLWLGQKKRSASKQESTSIQKMLFRSALGCRIRLWQEKRARLIEQVVRGKRKAKQGRAMSKKFFRRVLEDARKLLEITPREGALDLIQHTALLERGRAFSGSLSILLLILDHAKHKSIRRVAKQKALQIFRATNDWTGLITPLQKRLSRVPKNQRDFFWQKVQALVVLQGIRKAQFLVHQNKPKKAATMVMTAFREAPKTPKMLQTFYKAALVLEEQKQLVTASKLFLALFERNPQSRLAPMALYRHAASALKAGRLPQAGRGFELLANSYPRLKVAPRVYIAARALYESYHAYRRMGAFTRARKILRWMFKRYPRALSTARMRVFLQKHGRLPKAGHKRIYRRRRHRRRRRRHRRRRRRHRRRRRRHRRRRHKRRRLRHYNPRQNRSNIR